MKYNIPIINASNINSFKSKNLKDKNYIYNRGYEYNRNVNLIIRIIENKYNGLCLKIKLY